MGKNKLSKFAEMESFPHVFQCSSNTIRSGTSFEMKGKWNDMFFKNNNPIILELGCGKGEYTLELAKLYPDKNFIGVDIKGARIWTGAKESFQKEMHNVAFLRTDIEMINHFFGEGEINEIWITFPDPQMKKTSKRLTSTNFLKLYRQLLVQNGLIHLKTDSSFLFTYTCEMVKVNKFHVVSLIKDLYATQEVNQVLNIKTYYEQQWLGRGLSIKYIEFMLENHKEYVEPDIEIEPDSYRSFGRNRS